MSELPACCTPTDGATRAEVLYCAYNAGGDPATAGLNYQGKPCPTWLELPPNVRAKWEATAAAGVGLDSVEDVAVEDAAGLDFGAAIALLRAGRRVRRAGWNGKGMWLSLTEGQLLAKDVHHFRGAAHAYAVAEGVEVIRVGSHIDMRAADGSLVIGWLASQTDMLAEDWEVVPETPAA